MYMVYIAGPYTASFPEGIQDNVDYAIWYGEDVLSVLGCIPFVPHLFHFWDSIIPKPYDFWLSLDLEYIKRCDVLLRIPGISKGADIEVKFARDNNIPVVYSILELRELIAKLDEKSA